MHLQDNQGLTLYSQLNNKRRKKVPLKKGQQIGIIISKEYAEHVGVKLWFYRPYMWRINPESSVLLVGDFIEGDDTGIWIETPRQAAKKGEKGIKNKIMIPHQYIELLLDTNLDKKSIKGFGFIPEENDKDKETT